MSGKKEAEQERNILEEITSEEFETSINSLTVKVDGVNYTIREMSGQDRAKFNDLNYKNFIVDRGKFQGFKKFEGNDLMILSLTLYDPAGALVSRDVLEKWPGKVVSRLAAASAVLSDLEESKVDKDSEMAKAAEAIGKND